MWTDKSLIIPTGNQTARRQANEQSQNDVAFDIGAFLNSSQAHVLGSYTYDSLKMASKFHSSSKYYYQLHLKYWWNLFCIAWWLRRKCDHLRCDEEFLDCHSWLAAWYRLLKHWKKSFCLCKLPKANSTWCALSLRNCSIQCSSLSLKASLESKICSTICLLLLAPSLKSNSWINTALLST